MATLKYDDTQLRRLFADMEPDKRLKALKGGFRRVSNHVRKVALNNLRGKGINHADELGCGIRAIVFKRKAGFRVTIGSKKANKQGKGERGMHLNRQGLKKPVLIWAEQGTKRRDAKSRVRVKGPKGWFYTRYNRGLMPRYKFMEETRIQTEANTTEMLHTEVKKSITRVAKKYGCK